MRFRKKPVVIEAMQIAHDPDDEMVGDLSVTTVSGWMMAHGFRDFKVHGEHRPFGIAIETLEGVMVASPGDWIIRGIQGEFYPCKPDIFADSYEEI